MWFHLTRDGRPIRKRRYAFSEAFAAIAYGEYARATGQSEYAGAEGDRRRDRSLIELGCRMLDWMWQRGWDTQYGGMLYFVDLHRKAVQEYWHDMKFWWPHNETIIATLLAYLLTGEPRYARMHQQVHDWAHRHFADPVHGEWFAYLHRDGSLSVPFKGSLWKGPFHHPRMQLTCWRLLLDPRHPSAHVIL
jgi:N-acylglucosamine 2-epimerase